MSFDDRVDVVDLILKVLKEHEKNLDAIIYQLGETLTSQPSNGQSGYVTSYNQHKIVFRRWFEFKERCLMSDIVAFEAKDDRLMVTALKGGNLYFYSENIPEAPKASEEDGGDDLTDSNEISLLTGSPNVFSGKLQCGIGIQARRVRADLPNGDHLHKVVFSVDPEDTRTWLSEELKTEKRSIVHGLIE